ncbi:COG1361 S-layer family protein [Stratiformator vulcanicus]|uniref:Large cysteine-rich periplasmic protein omcB n=1 Tax=Stratiformator vulcanicus TaxID=2527980 RepID=A0A517R0T1_9PLAN|nr:hypothetical protein [Stratiformator vulcanicus]QDT37481.1 Large cysteine-rich periplasmic protein omcB precursor [Stratiformator vulcanicus]
MRLGRIVLAIGGILTTAGAVAVAQNGYTPGGYYGQATTRSDASFARGSATGTSRSDLKNYNRQLFGTERPQPKTAAAPAEGRYTLRSSNVRQAAATTNDTASKATNAGFEQSAGTNPYGQIETIGYKDGSNPFAGRNPFAALESEVQSRRPVKETIRQTSAAPEFDPAMPARDDSPRVNRLTITPPATGSVTRQAAPRNEVIDFGVDAFEPADTTLPPLSESMQPQDVRTPAFGTNLPTPQPSTTLRTTNTTALSDAASATGTQEASVSVKWVRRSEINVGQVCEIELVVKNDGPSTATGCEVDAFFPATVRLSETKPAAADAGDHVTWTIGELAGGEQKSFLISLVPSVRGSLDVAAYVRTTNVAGERFSVQEPMLAMTLKGPERVVVGDPATHTIVVSNPGTGTAKNVTVEATLPEGLEHAKGQKLAMNIGSLAPNETRVIRLALAATKGGPQPIEVLATAGETLSRTASNDVFVVAPSLRLEMDGPGLRYVGRTAKYTLRVTNDGSAPNNNVRVSHKVPSGFEFTKTDMSGRYDELNRMVTWFVGRLDAGETKELSLELTASEAGVFEHLAGAISEHGARAETSVQTEVDGIASLVLEVVDLDDPVEVGRETAYEIRVKNVGTKEAANVDISCKLPEGVMLLDARGPSAHKATGQVIFFRPLDNLGAGKTAVFQIHVKGSIEGDQRFRVRLASDSITEPLIFEELTKYYGG